jgi:hypothetical protein
VEEATMLDLLTLLLVAVPRVPRSKAALTMAVRTIFVMMTF